MFCHPVLAQVLFSNLPPNVVSLTGTDREVGQAQAFVETFGHLNPRLKGPVRVVRAAQEV